MSDEQRAISLRWVLGLAVRRGPLDFAQLLRHCPTGQREPKPRSQSQQACSLQTPRLETLLQCPSAWDQQGQSRDNYHWKKAATVTSKQRFRLLVCVTWRCVSSDAEESHQERPSAKGVEGRRASAWVHPEEREEVLEVLGRLTRRLSPG